MADSSRKEKICPDEACSEQWESLPGEVQHHCVSFVYCPFCANEMITRCSECGEAIADVNFQFCPWCGCTFEDKEKD